jgi:hypothetical protein
MDGRLPSLAAYAGLRVEQRDKIKLSSLHGSRNHKLLQGKEIRNYYTFVA